MLKQAVNSAMFTKLAREVNVRAHTRHEADGDVVEVDAHTRSIDEADSETADLATPVDIEEQIAEEIGDVVKEEADDPPPPVTETRAQRDLALWKEWKATGDKAKLKELFKNFDPLLRLKMSPFIGRVKMVPDSAIESEFKLRFVEALNNYNPEKGALATHIYNYLNKAKRFIADKQNIGRIPENRIYKIKQYKVAYENLKDKLDADPSLQQLSTELGWPLAEVKRMQSEMRSDLSSQGFEEDPYMIMPSKAEEVLRLFQYELDGQELTVYQHLTGYGRPKKSSTGDIAKTMGIPDYQVSRYKSAIEKKLSKYLDKK